MIGHDRVTVARRSPIRDPHNAVHNPAGWRHGGNQEQGTGDLFVGFIKGGVKCQKITVQDGETARQLGYAYRTWEADGSDKKIGEH